MHDLDQEAYKRIAEIKARLLELLEAVNKVDEGDDLDSVPYGY